MKRDWAIWLRVEEMAIVNKSIDNLRKKCYWMDFRPVRLMFLLFERFGFAVTALPALRFERVLDVASYLHSILAEDIVLVPRVVFQPLFGCGFNGRVEFVHPLATGHLAEEPSR